MQKIILIAISFSIILLSSVSHAISFSSAKKKAVKIYEPHMIGFYSGCKINKQGKKLVPEFASCGFKERKNLNRASRIEWEHVMPAYHFGHQLRCWQNGGRKECKKVPKFREMESDLHNLVPAIGEINGDRSNFKFGMIEGEARLYGDVNFEIDFKGKKAEPRDEVKGDIARIYFYMRDRYQQKLSKQQTQMLNAWNKVDPIDSWEREKNEKVYAIQGNKNSYISGGVTEPSKSSKSPAPPSFNQKPENKTTEKNSSGFSCGDKTKCGQMSSCDEATFYLKQCGVTKLDRDKDGTPCNSLCK